MLFVRVITDIHHYIFQFIVIVREIQHFFQVFAESAPAVMHNCNHTSILLSVKLIVNIIQLDF